MKFPIEFTCACGDRWKLAVPKKFQTKKFFDYVLKEWKKSHSHHLHKILGANEGLHNGKHKRKKATKAFPGAP